ncbi:hypothetical protein AAG570_002643, partial [Ranatra chinensis]
VKSHSHQRPPPQDDDDDGVDLFGSDSEEEDAEAARIKEQRLAEYATRKSKKPVLIAKSNIILDVKPWDDETNMKEMEAQVRKVTTDGLVWGASKLVPLAYGIHKLQISCVVEDEKVSVDWLQETIQEIEDYVSLRRFCTFLYKKQFIFPCITRTHCLSKMFINHKKMDIYQN